MPTKADLLLITLLLAASCIPFALWPEREPRIVCAEITLDGNLRQRIPLSGHHGTEEFTLETATGRNVIRIQDESITVIDADCPDKLCVQTGTLRHPGETSACLPHKLLIEIKGNDDNGILPTK